VKAGWLNLTLTNYRNADALDGVLGTARNIFFVTRCAVAVRMSLRVFWFRIFATQLD
jgi:hypothetical protein